jgi:sugar fermentation stimulation protein A
MNRIRLYPEWEKAYFIERLNRFVMSLEKDGKTINAYIANPGRMAEYLVPGHPFFVIRAEKGKYAFRVVSTLYENSYILLDTMKVNDIVEHMLRDNKIPELGEIKTIRREVSIKRSRFDFLLTSAAAQCGEPHEPLPAISTISQPEKFSGVKKIHSRKPVLLEVKSCSLCHAGVAMFPDAPTERGRRHLLELELLSNQGFASSTLYIITNRDAEVFLPNCHTDLEYCKVFHRSKAVHLLAYKVEMPDPVSIDISLSKRVPIDFERSRSICHDRGCYLLVLNNTRTFSKRIGALGEREFKKGYYVYAGSALKGLNSRIKRHMRKNKKIHWHLDYIFPYHMIKEKVFKIITENNTARPAAAAGKAPQMIFETSQNPLKNANFWPAGSMEKQLAMALLKISPSYVPGFGSSDTDAPSHLFYFPENPIRRRDFLDLLLDFRMSKRIIGFA